MMRWRTWGLLAGWPGLVACHGPIGLAPAPQLRHRHEAAYQQQVGLLQAGEVSFSASRFAELDSARNYLEITVRNPQHQPAAPDSLARRVRKLAHLLVTDLANADDYAEVLIQVETAHDYLLVHTYEARTFVFPPDSLR